MGGFNTSQSEDIEQRTFEQAMEDVNDRSNKSGGASPWGSPREPMHLHQQRMHRFGLNCASNSFGEALTLNTATRDEFGETAFEEVMKIKQGPCHGP